MIRFLPFALFFLFFILESLIVELFHSGYLENNWIFVPRFLLSGILLLTIYGSRKQGIWYGFIFGLFFDVIYTEIIGIYLFMMPLTVYAVSKLMKILQSNIIITTFVVLFGITILELIVYEMNFLIHVTTMPFSKFIYFRIFPTILLNFVFIIMVIYPLRRQFEKLNEKLA